MESAIINQAKKNEIQSPTNDLRDLFKIESLEPYYNENPTTSHIYKQNWPR